jgi:C-terminal processing protease CtpA/Prc
VLANYYTASNAEQFIVKLKLLKKNIVILGDRTAGVITYGHNYGKFLETPSKLFKLQFTDMDDNWKTYIKYEIVGIEPDIYLENTSNWVAQVTSRYRTATVRQ